MKPSKNLLQYTSAHSLYTNNNYLLGLSAYTGGLQQSSNSKDLLIPLQSLKTLTYAENGNFTVSHLRILEYKSSEIYFVY